MNKIKGNTTCECKNDCIRLCHVVCNELRMHVLHNE